MLIGKTEADDKDGKALNLSNHSCPNQSTPPAAIPVLLV